MINPTNYILIKQNGDDITKANFMSMGNKIGNFYFDNPNILYQFIVKNKQAKQYCFIEKKTKLYKLFWDFDIDNNMLIYFTDNQINFTEFWDYIIAKVVEALKYYIDEENNFFNYIYSNRTDVKHKLHVYFPNIIVDNSYALVIRNKVVQLIKNDNIYDLSDIYIDKIIDKSVFKANGLRLLFQSKKDQNGYYVLDRQKSTFKNIPKNRIEQLKLVSIRTNEEAINFKPTVNKDFFPLLELDKEVTKVKKIKVKKKIRDTNKKSIKSNYQYDFIYSLANNLSIERIDNYESWRDFVFLCGNYGWDNIAHQISKRSSKYNKNEVDNLLTISKNDHNNMLTIGSLIYWSNVDNPINHKSIMDNYNKVFYIPLKYDHSNDINEFKEYIESNTGHKNYNIKIICQDFLNELDLNNFDTFIIKSGLGTNKSGVVIKSIVDLVEKHNYGKITALASRVVLVSNLLGRLQENIFGEDDNRPIKLGMKSYNDIRNKKDLHKKRKLVQTPDSLIHMLDNKGKIDFPDILFIDEIESLLNYVVESDTLTDRRKMIFVILKEYIKRAKYVFLVDGNLTPFICTIIMELRKGNNISHFSKAKWNLEPQSGSVQILYNTMKTDTNRYYLVNSENEWMERIYNDLNKGKKLFICMDSKKMSDIIHKDLVNNYPDLNISLYNVSTNDEDKLNLKDVNKVWTKYDVVICSPTIVYGVDFSKVHFDAIYSYCQTTIFPSSIYQQLKRPRRLVQQEVFIYLKYPKNYNEFVWPTDMDELRQYILPISLESLVAGTCPDIQYRDQYRHILGSINEVYDNGFKLDTSDIFTKIFLHFVSLRNRANNDYRSELVKYLTEYGGQVFLEVKKCSITKLNKQLVELKNDFNNGIRQLEDNYNHRINKLNRWFTKELINLKDIDRSLKNEVLICDMFESRKNKYRDRFAKNVEKLNIDYEKNIKPIEKQQKELVNEKQIYDDNKDELENELTNEKIIELLKADKLTHKYHSIIHKTFKTREDKNIMTAHYIKNVFGIDKLSKNLLLDIGHLSNVDKFYNSLIYLANDEYKDKFINKYQKTEVCDKIMIIFRQAKLIKQLLELFWSNGLLDDKTIKVFTGITTTNEQQLFINQHEKELRSIFDGLKRKTIPKNPYKLLGWLDVMLKEFFGGFVWLDVSSRKFTRITNMNYYYELSINCKKYLELLINKNYSILYHNYINLIKELYKNKKCNYNIIHGQNNLIDILNNSTMVDYMFISL